VAVNKKDSDGRKPGFSSRRRRGLGAAAGKTDLGVAGGDSGVGLCLQMEEAVPVCGARLPLGWRAMPLWFQTRPGSYNEGQLIAFLRSLKKHLRGQKAILIWDGLPAHKSRKMKQYLESSAVGSR
jgi:hypothetical protein